jgi:hypothetical protein
VEQTAGPLAFYAFVFPPRDTAQFDVEWRRARLSQLRSWRRPKCRAELAILPLDETIDALGRAGEEPVGRREVALDAVVGTVARVGDFDRRFRPVNRHLRDRWHAVAAAERDLPPVALVQLGELYFVEDGHHRVSVARARGASTIRARVHRICTVACANRCLTIADLPAKSAERMFLERVPLPDDVRVGLRLLSPREWSELADAAEQWGATTRDRALAADRCRLAQQWWEHEVLPVVDELRCRGVRTDDGEIASYLRRFVAAGRS